MSIFYKNRLVASVIRGRIRLFTVWCCMPGAQNCLFTSWLKACGKWRRRRSKCCGDSLLSLRCMLAYSEWNMDDLSASTACSARAWPLADTLFCCRSSFHLSPHGRLAWRRRRTLWWIALSRISWAVIFLADRCWFSCCINSCLPWLVDEVFV